MFINNDNHYESMEALFPFIEENVNSGNSVKLTITGKSMFPLLRHRKDSVVLAKPDNLKKYDIILYNRENGIVALHRIVGVKNGGFVLAGDNEIKKEYPVVKKRIIAVVTSIYRGNKPFSINNKLYLLYVRFWCLIFPLRHILLKFMFFVYKFLRGNKLEKQ